MILSILQNKQRRKTLVIVVWLLIWQGIDWMIGKEILFVSPFGVLKAGYPLILTTVFWKTILFTMLRIMTGFFLGMVSGIVFAFFSCKSRFFYDFFQPVFSIMKATPIASFIILALVWMDKGTISIFISFLIVFPIAWTNIRMGIQNVDHKLLEMAQMFCFSKMKKFRLIFLPSVLPYFISSCTTGIGLAWKSGIAAEVISTPNFSIGTSLYNAKIYLETPELFVWTTVIIFLSVGIEKGFLFCLKCFYKKYHWEQ